MQLFASWWCCLWGPLLGYRETVKVCILLLLLCFLLRCVLCAAAMLLFVSLLFLLFLVGFIALGYLRFTSFYSFVFQPIEICLFSSSELRSFHAGVQLAAGACLLCLGCCNSSASLLLLLTLLGCGGRLLALGFIACCGKNRTGPQGHRETIAPHKIHICKTRLTQFIAGAAIQLTALVGLCAILCTVPHATETADEEQQQEQQNQQQLQLVKRVISGIGFLASLIDLLLLVAQIIAFMLKNKHRDKPSAAAAVSLAGGDLEGSSSILCLVGRPHIHYDVEKAQYWST